MTKKTEISASRCPIRGVYAGAGDTGKGLCFQAAFRLEDQVELVLYKKGTPDILADIPVPPDPACAGVRSVLVQGVRASAVEYNYRVNGKIVTDPDAPLVNGRETFGDLSVRDEHRIRGALPERNFDWGEEKKPGLPFEEVIAYSLHVRGFTMQKGSGVRARGTFRGITEKIPYFRSLGINQLVLMPATEFEDAPLSRPASVPSWMEKPAEAPQRPSAGTDEAGVPGSAAGTADMEKSAAPQVRPDPERRVNYWGFSENWYFAPKKAFCAGPKPDIEFKEMVKALHAEGIELVMTFAFPGDVPMERMVRILAWWSQVYHVDGFWLYTDEKRAHAAAASPLLAGVKLMNGWFDPEWTSLWGGSRHLADANSGFREDCRRILKGDENMLAAFVGRMRTNDSRKAVINYMTGHDGFTLMDLVSYDKKHNEENGEQNRDGSACDFSWNCGVEGPSRKRQIQALRMRQMKNAMAMVLLAAGTPLLQAGDEFGNSQGGNNNPWCIDSEVTWLDWRKAPRYAELTDFVRQLIRIRKENPILHTDHYLSGNDQISCGYPDFSCHGSRAWYGEFEYQSRHIGLMYCGMHEGSDQFVYTAFNFHWEAQTLALPDLPEGRGWKIAADTAGSADDAAWYTDKTLTMPGRSIKVLVSAKKPAEGAKAKKPAESAKTKKPAGRRRKKAENGHE